MIYCFQILELYIFLTSKGLASETIYFIAVYKKQLFHYKFG